MMKSQWTSELVACKWVELEASTGLNQSVEAWNMGIRKGRLQTSMGLQRSQPGRERVGGTGHMARQTAGPTSGLVTISVSVLVVSFSNIIGRQQCKEAIYRRID
jgi:hypothetical protein